MTRPSNAYLIHGMKRSGNHAIVNWLLPQIDCTHFNNLIPVGPIFRGRPMPDPLPFNQWLSEQQRLRGQSFAGVLATLEDHDLGLLPFTDVDIPLRRLLVLRDARQLFSSRIRKAFKVSMPAYPREIDPILLRAVALWKQHARCFLGAFTDDEQAIFPERVAILYDAWFRDPAYRAAISAALDIGFDDRGFGRVTSEGGGSSFDGTSFDGRVELMGVADRVACLDPHEKDLLDEIFRDPELLELCEAVGSADPFAQLTVED